MKKAIDMRDMNSICEEQRGVSGAVVIGNGSETMFLLTTQKRSLFWILEDPVRRLHMIWMCEKKSCTRPGA